MQGIEQAIEHAKLNGLSYFGLQAVKLYEISSFLLPIFLYMDALEYDEISAYE